MDREQRLHRMHRRTVRRRILVLLLILALLFSTGAAAWAALFHREDEGSPESSSAEVTAAEDTELSAFTYDPDASHIISEPSSPDAYTHAPKEETVVGPATSEEPQASEEETSEPAEESVSEAAPSSRAEEILASMSLHEKVCQLFMVMPSQITGAYPTVAAGETTRQALADYPVAGFIYDASNMESQEQLLEMTQNVQSFSRIPMLLTCDEEGGRVGRLMNTVDTTWVDAMLTYKDDGPEVAFQNAKTIAEDMLSCGLNMDLAPVADVWSNPDNTVIGDRAYSDDFAQAAELISSAVQGFHAGGAACTLKHFPGHGDTSSDSHYGAVYIYKSMDDIRLEELLPFRSGIEAGADCVMIGHLIITDVEDTPALFSHELVTEILREELGFEGVVITDSLQMQAMSDYFTSGEIAVKAIWAGVDLLLCPSDLGAAITALEEAVADGTISEARIDESVLRILQLKEKLGLL